MRIGTRFILAAIGGTYDTALVLLYVNLSDVTE